MDISLTIILAYRDRKLISVERCLRSLASQTRNDFVVHFVDYGSKSSISQSVRGLVEQFPFCRYIYTDTRGWPWNKSRALNIGIRLAETPYVMNTDIDIIFRSDFIHTLLDIQDGKSAVYCAPHVLPENFDDWENIAHESKPLPMQPGMIGTCQCYPISVIKELQGFDEQFEYWGLEDNDLRDRLDEWGLIERWADNRTAIFHQWHPPAIRRTPSYQQRLLMPYYKEVRGRLIRNGPDWGAITSQEQRPLFNLFPLAANEKDVSWHTLLNDLALNISTRNLGSKWLITDRSIAQNLSVFVQGGYQTAYIGTLSEYSWLYSFDQIEYRVDDLFSSAISNLNNKESGSPGVIVIDVSTYLRFSKTLFRNLLDLLTPGGFLVIANLSEPKLPIRMLQLGRILTPYLNRIRRSLSKASPRTLRLVETFAPRVVPATVNFRNQSSPIKPPGVSIHFKPALEKMYPLIRQVRTKTRQRCTDMLTFFDNNLRDSLNLVYAGVDSILDFTLDFPASGATAIFLKKNENARRIGCGSIF
jgi:glycosyltransferase involved in cell wall biosynthesis